ncbi:MAG: threonine ammonia-lyase [Nitrospirota bacterium]|nr:threonine ammonia-lyase [Nitrospirota bacterium]
MVTLADIQQAREKISPYIHRTPLIRSNSLSTMTGADVHLKLENLQKTGSFKVRGAFNKLLRVPEGRVIAASMGNHAQAVAYAAASLGKRSVIVMPESAAIVKQEATRGYGAEVVLKGERFQEALDLARSRTDAVFIHPFDDDDVIAGQGTIGIEILEDLQNIDAVLVPVGGGGLIAGIAAAVKARSPRTQVVGIQTESATSACRSFRGKRLCEHVPGNTIADGIAVGLVGERTLEVITAQVDDMVTVTEDAIARAILLFLERKKLVVEGAGAVTLAALLEHGDRFRGKRVVLVLSGGNIDFTLVDRIILKGLVSSNRISVFSMVLDDVAGSLHRATGLIAEARANIVDVVHDRLAGGVPVGKTRVLFTVEVRNSGHLSDLFALLRAQGLSVSADT